MTRTWWLLAGVLLIAAAWYGWSSYAAGRTEWISAKTAAAESAAMEAVEPALPRVYVEDGRGDGYYAPDIHAPRHSFDLYSAVLVALNQDGELPPIKVTNLVSQLEYRSNETIATAYATVEFPLIAGLTRQVQVHSSVELPHFRTPG